MNLSILTTILNIIARIAGATTGSQGIQDIINLLVSLIPVLIQGYQSLLPIVQNFIAVLQQNTDITDDQITQLEAASALIDAHFDATAAAARVADAQAKLLTLVPATV